ncbi:MAG: iron-sulfur cluster assembly protein [Pirellulales bacterium]
MPDRDAVLKVLADVKDPESGRSLGQMEQIRGVDPVGDAR